ncbi:hypothetical protein D3C87_489460 [compost metagenome]
MNAFATPNENTNLSKFIANFNFYGDVKIVVSTASAYTKYTKPYGGNKNEKSSDYAAGKLHAPDRMFKQIE